VNSHLYRKKLMTLMEAANLDGTSKFMVYFLFSVIKNQSRVMKALREMDQSHTSQTWYNPVRDFIATNVVQYNTDVAGSSKISAVVIPNCNPGLDILVACLITNQKSWTTSNLSTRTTFCQLHLSGPLQNMAKDGYKKYWTEIIKGTKNKNSTEKPSFNEDYYNTSAADKYKLVLLKKNNVLEEFKPTSDADGYSEADFLNYFRQLGDSLQTLAK
jgi:hypothetical protein